jgi:hypothetical protein
MMKNLDAVYLDRCRQYGLSSFGLYLDDLNITVSDTQREMRLLRRRVRRLEKSEDE